VLGAGEVGDAPAAGIGKVVDGEFRREPIVVMASPRSRRPPLNAPRCSYSTSPARRNHEHGQQKKPPEGGLS
jgi:hypothetical protein